MKTSEVFGWKHETSEVLKTSEVFGWKHETSEVLKTSEVFGWKHETSEVLKTSEVFGWKHETSEVFKTSEVFGWRLGALYSKGLLANSVSSGFRQHLPHKLFRHINKSVCFLNADLANRTAWNISMMG